MIRAVLGRSGMRKRKSQVLHIPATLLKRLSQADKRRCQIESQSLSLERKESNAMPSTDSTSKRHDEVTLACTISYYFTDTRLRVDNLKSRSS